jgi:hypothetical protein
MAEVLIIATKTPPPACRYFVPQIRPSCTEPMTHFINRNGVANLLPSLLLGTSQKPKEASWKLSTIGFDTVNNIVCYRSSLDVVTCCIYDSSDQ